MSWAVSAATYTFPPATGEKEWETRKSHLKRMKLRPCGFHELARRDHLSLQSRLPFGQQYLLTTSRAWPRQWELTANLLWGGCTWLPRLNSFQFVLPEPLFPDPSTFPKFSKTPSLPRPPCFFFLMLPLFSPRAPVPTLPNFLFHSPSFADFYYTFLASQEP